MVRLEAFRWLQDQVAIFGDVLPFDLLRQGFVCNSTRVPLLGPQGIFKPAALPALPLSITTAPNGPYDDSFTTANMLAYRYRGSDPDHRDNVGLRNAMRCKAPLIYFHGVAKGQYLAVWPVFVVADEPRALTFTVAADDERTAEAAALRTDGPSLEVRDAEVRRAYITATVRVRLHQRAFRERVLHAYRNRCTICRLRHRDLLDAAHIVPDCTEAGDPEVTNGLSLCKIHHAAFDRLIIGIRPDYVVQVHPRILMESDGPMLRHGLQGLHNSPIFLPTAKRHHPDRERLECRYDKFRGAA
jgi:putative restriction endonuclease